MSRKEDSIVTAIACGVAATCAVGIALAFRGPEPVLVESIAVTLREYPELDRRVAAGLVVSGRQRFRGFGTTVQEAPILVEPGSNPVHPNTVMLVDLVHEFGWPCRAIAYRERQFIQQAPRPGARGGGT